MSKIAQLQQSIIFCYMYRIIKVVHTHVFTFNDYVKVRKDCSFIQLASRKILKLKDKALRL